VNKADAIFRGFDWRGLLDREPLLLAIAGPNGAGKTTFYEAYLARTGLPFVNADVLARELGVDAYAAAEMAANIREEWIRQKRSFVFETVFSDPVGDKVMFLQKAAEAGYTVALFFIGIDSPETSDTRVAIRVSQGGHDVPRDKLASRFPRTIANLRLAIEKLPLVFVYDNSDLAAPYRQIAFYRNGVAKALRKRLPKWFPAK
jgi:predicted ABC-type ATPase